MARRIVAKFGGDIKGLQTLLGHAGSASTWYCLFCKARLNQTNPAGLPCLPAAMLPDEWKGADVRPMEVGSPAPRTSTDWMAEQAKRFAAKKASAADPKKVESKFDSTFFGWSQSPLNPASTCPSSNFPA